MIPIILLAAGGVVALDLAKRYLPPGMLQSLRGHTANGAPLQIVIPVDGNTTNGKSQIPSATGQPTTLRINIPGWPWWG
ncbi:MAG: hypothetical protein KGJ13_11940, partial [Patescibacteria group bacterium]|nr:hypothetical protein [Patescibacteria group bacterium]